jgi:hypothetical protein
VAQRQQIRNVVPAVTAAALLVASAVASNLTSSSFSIITSSLGIAATAAAGITAAHLASWADARKASPSATEAAVARIRQTVEAMRAQAGMAHMDIDPCVQIGTSAGELPESDKISPVRSSSFVADFIADLSEDVRSTVVVGSPGSGKSALLLRLAEGLARSYMAEPQGHIPLYLQCKTWDSEFRSISQWLHKQAARDYGIPPSLSKNWVMRRSLVLLLDGIDEADPSTLESLTDAIYRWTRSAAGSKVVISCRTSDYQDLFRLLSPDRVVLLQPLRDQDIHAYLRNALAGWSPSIRIQDLEKRMLESTIDLDPLRRLVLLGLLGEGNVADEDPDDEPQSSTVDAVAEKLFSIGNSRLHQGNLPEATEAYQVVSKMINSRWRAPAIARLGACLYLQGKRESGQSKVMESVAIRLQDSIEARDAVRKMAPLSPDERKLLNVLSDGVSYEEEQLSSFCRILPSRLNEVLLSLRERGLVEVLDYDNGTTRFRISLPTPPKGW